VLLKHERNSFAHVDFSGLHPIRQQLMSNFQCAVRFTRFPELRSIESGDILAAISLGTVPTNGGSPVRRLPAGLSISIFCVNYFNNLCQFRRGSPRSPTEVGGHQSSTGADMASPYIQRKKCRFDDATQHGFWVKSRHDREPPEKDLRPCGTGTDNFWGARSCRPP
jgi:hypothetical protein